MTKQKPKQLLEWLNAEYAKLHTQYENYFWLSYMGDHSVNDAMTEALHKRDAFRANPELLQEVQQVKKHASAKEKERLKVWERFFKLYQTPPELLDLKNEISKLERTIHEKRSSRTEGYIDPHTKKFVVASESKMRTITATHPDEAVRKATFMAREELALTCINEYVQLVKLLNTYAKKLGFEDFYAYKLHTEEGMTKKELFSLFDNIYDKTKYAFKALRDLEKKSMPGLRKPWNFGRMMTGDFTKEEDPYFQFEDALRYWGASFAALGVNYQQGTLTLDLLNRKGKYSNGFCHWPELVRFEKNKRIPGSANFTCNVVAGQVGSGFSGIHTLFHEGGHAAHLLNTEQKEVVLNHEYPPAATSWDETQSMFMDSVFGSIEWKIRYAKNQAGESYPFNIFERMVEKLHPLMPLDLSGILMVSEFEKHIYESKNLSAEKVKAIAKKAYKKHTDRSEDSLSLLNVPHIYSWESICSYHGYGLAELAVTQWRTYFYDKYGYIVDNPRVGKEMTKVWKLGAAKTFKEFVKLATGKKLSADTYIRNITKSKEKILTQAKKRIARLERVPLYTKKIDLNAHIRMVHGKEEIANNKKSFEAMAKQYAQWFKKQKEKPE